MRPEPSPTMRSGLVAVVALLLDRLFGEPPSAAHPVVWLGSLVGLLERRAPPGAAARLVYGAGVTALAVVGAGLAGRAAARLVGRLPAPLGVVCEGWLLKTALSAGALVEAGRLVEANLDDGDLIGARENVRALVSRDPAGLDESLLVGAAVESLAENCSDSIVGPLLAYGLGGLSWAFAYRAANTLDAMIGYRGEYEHLGKAAARLDDLLNLVPARLTSLLLLLGGAVAGGDVANGLAMARRDHGLTASPNAGWPMSTMAGLLGSRLEKVGQYRLAAELPAPDVPAIDQAVEIVRATTVLAVPTTVVLGGAARRCLVALARRRRVGRGSARR